MTPFEKRGWTKDTVFKIVLLKEPDEYASKPNHGFFKIGEKVVLDRDDGSPCPRMKSLESGQTNYCSLNRLEPVKSKPSDSPEFKEAIRLITAVYDGDECYLKTSTGLVPSNSIKKIFDQINNVVLVLKGDIKNYKLASEINSDKLKQLYEQKDLIEKQIQEIKDVYY